MTKEEHEFMLKAMSLGFSQPDALKALNSVRQGGVKEFEDVAERIWQQKQRTVRQGQIEMTLRGFEDLLLLPEGHHVKDIFIDRSCFGAPLQIVIEGPQMPECQEGMMREVVAYTIDGLQKGWKLTMSLLGIKGRFVR